MRLGDVNNPEFELACGVVIQLRPIRSLVLQRYMVEWEKGNPQPLPLKYQMSNGEWADADFDPAYQSLKESWDRAFQDHQTSVVFKLGVASPVPADWQPEFDIFADNPKLNWLYSVIADEELEALSTAIVGLANATQAGVEDAQKN